MNRRTTLLATLLIAGTSVADEQRSLYELMSGWGTDLDSANVSSEPLGSGLHVLRAAGGAIIVSIGSDGVLLVDDQFPQVLPKLMQTIGKLGGSSDVDYVINTHWHFDHADGNPALGASGARIIAHDNSRRQMQQETRVSYVGYHYVQPAYPQEGLPVITFNDSLTLHFNGQAIEMRYFGPAHTTGDAAVFFRNANVVHVGDLYSGGYPYIDAPNGGTLSGLIAVCRSIAEQINDETTIVSGHAPLASRADLLEYITMLESSYMSISQRVQEGMSLEEVLLAKPTAAFDDQRGNPTLFVSMAYRSIASK